MNAKPEGADEQQPRMEREGSGWCMTDPTDPPDATSPPEPPPWRTLSDELAELERTNPDVRRAAENYDRTVRRILRKQAAL